MRSIHFLMEKLGLYNEKFKQGTCFGCATMAAQAFVLGEQEYDRYRLRLKRIKKVADQYTKLPPLKHVDNSTYIDRLNREEDRLKKIIKNLPSSNNNYLDDDEKEWVSMRAFLEGIAVAQEPLVFHEKYKIFPTRLNNNISQLQFNAIAELTQSKLAETQGEFRQIADFSGVYSVKEMRILLNSWEQCAKEQNDEQSRYALIMGDRSHTFMLGYDVANETWIIDNNSSVKKYSSGFLLDNRTTRLSKDIFLHFQNVEAGKIFFSSNYEKVIVNTRICSTNPSHSKMMSQLFADENWKLLHQITPEKAKFQSKKGDSWLFIASRYGQTDSVKELLQAGANPNILLLNPGVTPLYIAAQNGHEDIVKNLIDAGAYIDLPSLDGCTPLYTAAQNGHENIVKDLINAGADINLPFLDGSTPLCIAAQNGHGGIAKDLINAGADINLSPLEGYTPLYIAAQNGRGDIVKDLINAGANVNTPYTENGNTPLYIAAENNYPKCIKTLLEADADTNILSNAGAAPLYIAAQIGHVECVKELLEAGANPNISLSCVGATPLYIAAHNGHIEIVKDLLQAEADINLAAEGNTPLEIATQNGHTQVVNELEKAMATIDKLSSAAAASVGATAQPNIVTKQLSHKEKTSSIEKLTVSKNNFFAHSGIENPELTTKSKLFAGEGDKGSLSKPQLEKKLNEDLNYAMELLKAPSNTPEDFKKQADHIALSKLPLFNFERSTLDEKDKEKKKQPVCHKH